MTELYEGLLTTRAMRRFTDEPVTDDEVLACLRAAVQAPSGGNIQPWQFIVVTEPVVKGRVGEIYRRAYYRYEAAMLPTVPPFRSDDDRESWERTLAASRHLADHMGEGPVLVFVAMPDISLSLTDADGELDIGTLYASVYPAVQNLLLAARSLGIGGALTTVYRIYHDEVRQVLGVPDQFQLVALVPLGRPTGRFGVARRRPAEAVTHWNRWGEKRRER